LENEARKPIEANTVQAKVTKPLYSDREIRRIVKEFLEAYISGQVEIVFPEANDILAIWKQIGRKLDWVAAEKEANDLRVLFMKQIAICAGSTKATPEEMEDSLEQVFRDIISYRNSKRLKGVFHDLGIENRLHELEEGLEKTNKLVEEIVEWLMKGN
jgi:hypothetical protein